MSPSRVDREGPKSLLKH
jgi:hypothetical protein